ncbi:MAG: hypothetical protein Ct9H300mP1_00950 [Planctomycetaceae bacterium]|nr:MAG: hypothetical protein Ct9H300mP1_00950 [Planctomycetaceae bacterium]
MQINRGSAWISIPHFLPKSVQPFGQLEYSETGRQQQDEFQVLRQVPLHVGREEFSECKSAGDREGELQQQQAQENPNPNWKSAVVMERAISELMANSEITTASMITVTPMIVFVRAPWLAVR